MTDICTCFTHIYTYEVSFKCYANFLQEGDMEEEGYPADQEDMQDDQQGEGDDDDDDDAVVIIGLYMQLLHQLHAVVVEVYNLVKFSDTNVREKYPLNSRQYTMLL